MSDQRNGKGRLLKGHIPLNADQTKYSDYEKKLQKMMKKQKRKEGKE